MQLRFWGTRGSIPSPGAATVRYGGNTPCTELRTSAGHLVILDAGTGIRDLGRSLLQRADGQPVVGDIFLTHAHWDHIQGLPFFAPIFQRGNHFTIWGSASLETSIDRVVRDQMSPVVFPVTFDELDAAVDFREIRPGTLHANGVLVSAFDVRHPGGALGYRIADPASPERSLVYISDNELGDAAKYPQSPATWRRELVEWMRGASVLVHDATYSPEEYDQHRGWGHSTDFESVDLALEAGVQTLVLFHHRPERRDDDVDARVAATRERVRARGAALDVVAAAEGLTLTV